VWFVIRDGQSPINGFLRKTAFSTAPTSPFFTFFISRDMSQSLFRCQDFPVLFEAVAGAVLKSDFRRAKNSENSRF